MEGTYNIKAIILNNIPWRENGATVITYSSEKGKLELAARGIKKINSKLAGHLEPITFSNIMAVRGRRYDYVGAAVSENCYANIKGDLDKLEAAGQILNIFNKIVKEGEKDEKLFALLRDALGVLNGNQLFVAGYQLLGNFFILKLLAESGHKPELYNCAICKTKITPDNNKFDLDRGGVVCGKCILPAGKEQLTISADCIKVLRIVAESDLTKSIKLKINTSLSNEVMGIISSFLGYHF